MKVLPLNSDTEMLFWDYVNKDIPNFYFFILDMRCDRASTKIWLALSNEKRIQGMMLVYKQSIVQLRGSVDAAAVLLDDLDFERITEIEGLDEHKAPILSRFRSARKAFEIILMTLRKGEENPQMRHPIARLSTEDAEDIAALMRRENPEWWAETTAERIAKRMNERLWLGTRIHGKLVSVGGATIDDWGSNIGTVVTHESYRNRGYATSIVSALVEQILQRSNLALIHVESGNQPAFRVYTKVGFRPYRRYFVARARKS